MPTSAESSPFIRTYIADAGSSPTSTVARPGVPGNDATSRATSAFTRAATALPSMISALIGRAAYSAALLERRVVRHQLALGAVRGEADDHEAARLHADHHALAELRVDHVVAEGEDRARPGR